MANQHIFKSGLIYPWNLLGFLKKYPTLKQFLLSFLSVNKILRLNNLKPRTVMNAKISVLLICVKGSYICYCTICTWLYLKNKHYVNKINFAWGIEFRRGFFVGFSEHCVGFLSISRKLASAKIIRNLSIHEICEI